MGRRTNQGAKSMKLSVREPLHKAEAVRQTASAYDWSCQTDSLCIRLELSDRHPVHKAGAVRQTACA